MNKGLEVLEAAALFGVDVAQVDVVVHPQSIVHSMVELVDGSTLAQLNLPDMRLPIAYALGFPERFDDGFGRLALDEPLELTFEPPDLAAFPCLGLADECAVEAFLKGTLSWRGIAHVIEATLERYDHTPCKDIETLLRADMTARRVASGIIEGMALSERP